MFKLCFENMLLDSSDVFLWKLSEDYYSYLLQGFITSVLVSWKINVFGMAKEKGVSNEKAWLYEDFYYILLLYFKFCFRLVKPFVQIIMIVNIFHGKHGAFAMVGTLAQIQLKLRKRLFCCPNVVLKQTIERCLKHCNVTDPSEEFISIGPYCQNTSLSLQHICKGK